MSLNIYRLIVSYPEFHNADSYFSILKNLFFTSGSIKKTINYVPIASNLVIESRLAPFQVALSIEFREGCSLLSEFFVAEDTVEGDIVSSVSEETTIVEERIYSFLSVGHRFITRPKIKNAPKRHAVTSQNPSIWHWIIRD
ncbi:hypothetical protein HRD83_12960 [Enterococcus faecalis]|nr:hypothetical protein [Enterococcus faecalis]NSN09568.1 hypothetical protein [Enterococcus faecalis]